MVSDIHGGMPDPGSSLHILHLNENLTPIERWNNGKVQSDQSGDMHREIGIYFWAFYCDRLTSTDHRGTSTDHGKSSGKGSVISTIAKIHHIVLGVTGGPNILNPPLSIASLDLCELLGLRPSTLEIVFEPLEKILRPVPSSHIS